jgi:hypothetical protein
MTNNKQQTGVEWYSRRLFEIEIAHNQGVINSDVYLKSKTHALEQAKAMEKERIETAYNKGTMHGIDYPESTLPITGEQYYNETYGGSAK